MAERSSRPTPQPRPDADTTERRIIEVRVVHRWGRLPEHSSEVADGSTTVGNGTHHLTIPVAIGNGKSPKPVHDRAAA